MNEIRKGKVIQMGDYTITPIEQVVIGSSFNDYGLLITVTNEPLGIIVELNKTQWAIDINGQEVSVEDLMGATLF